MKHIVLFLFIFGSSLIAHSADKVFCRAGSSVYYDGDTMMVMYGVSKGKFNHDTKRYDWKVFKEWFCPASEKGGNEGQKVLQDNCSSVLYNSRGIIKPDNTGVFNVDFGCS